MQRAALLPQIPEVGLEPVDALLALERLAVPRDDVDEVDRLELLERVGPLVHVAVDEIRDVVHEKVAGAEHLLLRQVDDEVAAGVAVAKVQEPNLAIAAEERHAIDQRHVRRRHLQLLEAGGECRLHAHLLLQALLRRGVGLVGGAGLQVVDLFGQALQQVGEHALFQHIAGQLPPGELVADDVDAGRKRLIPVGVVVVKVCVDEEAHGLVGNRLELLQHRPARLRRDVGVDNHHLVPVHDDRGVGTDVHRSGADRAVHARHDFGELVRRLWRRRLRVEHEGARDKEGEHQRDSDASHVVRVCLLVTYRAIRWPRRSLTYFSAGPAVA